MVIWHPVYAEVGLSKSEKLQILRIIAPEDAECSTKTMTERWEPIF